MNTLGINKIYLIIILSLILTSCNSQNKTKTLNDVKSEILNEKELMETSNKAIEFIQQKNYNEFKNLFATEILKNLNDEQIHTVVNQLSEFIKINGLPKKENIIPALTAIPKGADTLFVNKILYHFKNNQKTETVLSFSFLKKYGTSKLFSVNVENPLQSKNATPEIGKLKDLNFNTKDILGFRIYYDEGIRKTEFNGNKGIFAIQGDFNTLEKSKLDNKFTKIFNELKKTKIEKSEVFNGKLNRGNNPEFIQVEFMFKNLNYGIFIYLPINNGGIYKDYIIVQQRQYANLGYQYYLKKENYLELMKELNSIKKMKLNDYYEVNP